MKKLFNFLFNFLFNRQKSKTQKTESKKIKEKQINSEPEKKHEGSPKFRPDNNRKRTRSRNFYYQEIIVKGKVKTIKHFRSAS